MRALHTLALLAVLAGLLMMGAPVAQAHTADQPYMQVRIAWPTAAQIAQLRAMPDLDPMRVSEGEEVILVSHPDQVERLRAMGFEVQIQIPDMEEYYAAQRTGYRMYGVLLTYSEMVTQLDQIHTQYPDITTARFSIGTSHEGRALWGMKLSDNPNIDEDEPEVLFDGVHHAREPITVSVLIETLRYLCENYGVDPEITFLVDNREVYFIPVINPDGYVYNEQTYPSGGGMWRKNRRAPTGGCYGVDNNRNYPYQWGGIGGSTDPCDETYRGPSAGSEPENQALMNFFNAHEIVTHDSYHSTAALILFPWSYTTQHTQDDALFRQMAATMSQWCGYGYGQPGEVLYVCSGTTTDWAYGEQVSKPKVFSFCTEVGGSDFWPADSEVPGLVAENIPKNLYLIKSAGCYLSVADITFTGGDGDGVPDPGETLQMVVTVHNDGVIANAQNVALTLVTDDAYVQLNDAAATIGAIPAGGSGSNATNPLSLTIDPSCPAGHQLELTLGVTATGFAMNSVHDWLVGDLPALFADNMESGIGQWTHGVVTQGFVDQWHQSTQRNHTAGGSTSWKFGDTGTGDYANLADGALVTPAVTIGSTAQLTFWHWMEAEESQAHPGRAYDGGLIEASVNGGAWQQVTPDAGYTHTIRAGGTPGPFPAGTPVFSGSFDWRQDRISLNGMAGSLRVRFRFGSDGATVREGWFIDDVSIVGIASGNTPPTAPTLVSPADGATVTTSVPTLTVGNATDPNPGSTLTYGYQVFSDALLTDLVTSVDGVAQGTMTTSWVVTPPLADGMYHWRAYAYDGTERGPCMPAASFTVDTGGSGIADSAPAHDLRLLSVAPNPASGATALRFELGGGGIVRAEIFDLQGRQVRQLAGRFALGVQSLLWDGRDAGGHAVPTGIYLYRLDAGEQTLRGRIMIAR